MIRDESSGIQMYIDYKAQIDYNICQPCDHDETLTSSLGSERYALSLIAGPSPRSRTAEMRGPL